jgi:hypothetical protein
MSAKEKRAAYAKTWRATHLRECAASQRAWAAAHPERAAEIRKASIAKKPTQYRERARARYTANREAILEKRRLALAGLSAEQKAKRSEAARASSAKLRAKRPDYDRARWQRVVEARAGRPRPRSCELCGETPSRVLHMDHDHGTGAFRGWLCFRCNVVLGRVRDDAALLAKMIDYLEPSRRHVVKVAH